MWLIAVYYGNLEFKKANYCLTALVLFRVLFGFSEQQLIQIIRASQGEKKYFPTFLFFIFFPLQALDTTAAALWMRISHDTLQLSSSKTVTPSNGSQQGLLGNGAIIFGYKTLLLCGHWWRAMSPVD